MKMDHNNNGDSGKSGPTLVEYAERLLSRYHLDSLGPELRAYRAALREEGLINVAVLGRFKAGKSSFLNEILGRGVLPVDVLPATSVVTRVRCGRQDQVVVRFLDGRSESIPLSRLPEFVTEAQNPGNEKQVALVDVEIPYPDDLAGLRFVDTPGIGSVFAHNTRVALDWLPEVGAALLVVSIDQPLSEHDLDLLADLIRHTPEIVVLLTKADLVAPAQVARVADFVRAQAAERLNRELRVIPFSVLPEQGGLKQEALAYLADEVAGRRHEQYERILVHKARSLQQRLEDYLSLALAAAEADAEARASLRSLLNAERGHLGQAERAISLVAQDLERRSYEAAHRRFDALAPAVEQRVLEAFSGESRTWKGHLGRTSAAFQEWVERALAGELERASLLGDDFVGEYLEEAKLALGRSVRAFQDRLGEDVERVLGIEFLGADFAADLEPPSHPDIRLDHTFDIPLDLLWFLVPMPIFRPLIYRHFRRQIPWEVQKNLHRLGTQWAEVVGHSITEVARQARDFIRQELNTVEVLVSHGEDKRGEIESVLRELGSHGWHLNGAGADEEHIETAPLR